MKKFICIICLMIAVCANAQTAYEKANILDNTSIGVTAGIASPLDFNSVTPFNTNFGLKLQKDFSPIFGLQAEGIAFVNDNHFANLPTWIKIINVNVNGVYNWSNILCGYTGSPRFFEVSSVTGLGWLYGYNTDAHFLSAKTGLDFAFNLSKGHSIVITPAVYWNLSATDKIQFNKNHAQLAINVGYVYHFKTSNGTHSFKTYDIGALNSRINYLQQELAKKPKEIVREVTKTTTKTKVKTIDNIYNVSFKKGSSEVSDVSNIAKALKKTDSKITIVGSTSPEGSEAFNKKLGIARAQAVKDALVKAGISADRINITSDYTAQRRASIIIEK